MKRFWVKKMILGAAVGLVVAIFSAQMVGATSLSVDEVLVLTNKERTKRGLKTLATNQQLQAMAEAKAVDILAKQYFEHVSPEGKTLVDLAKEAGYGYVLVGENLALGNFSSSVAVVKGWMNSPGHRANILKTKFTEIGIATVTGTYKGREVWVSVQEFGRPKAACPQISVAERELIMVGEEAVGLLDKELRALRQLVNEATTGVAYNELIEKYNTQVGAYNAAASDLRAKVATFNNKVSAYNRCINT